MNIKIPQRFELQDEMVNIGSEESPYMVVPKNITRMEPSMENGTKISFADNGSFKLVPHPMDETILLLSGKISTFDQLDSLN